MLITVFYVFLALVALAAVAAAFMKKEYTLSSSVVIGRPKDEVFIFVKHLKNQTRYSKWVMADQNVELDYRGEDGTPGFIAAWRSNNKNVGVGEQEITKVIEGQSYEVEIRFEKPFKGVSYATMTIEEISPTQCRASNIFRSHAPFPMNLITFFLQNMLQKDLDQTMANLKRVLEE